MIRWSDPPFRIPLWGTMDRDISPKHNCYVTQQQPFFLVTRFRISPFGGRWIGTNHLNITLMSLNCICFPDLSNNITFCSGPISVDPICPQPRWDQPLAERPSPRPAQCTLSTAPTDCNHCNCNRRACRLTSPRPLSDEPRLALVLPIDACD